MEIIKIRSFVLGGPGSSKISLCNILANKIQRLVHIDVEGELKNESSFNKGIKYKILLNITYISTYLILLNSIT